MIDADDPWPVKLVPEIREALKNPKFSELNVIVLADKTTADRINEQMVEYYRSKSGQEIRYVREESPPSRITPNTNFRSYALFYPLGGTLTVLTPAEP